jgi:iron(III) transport system substrate-binding protein
MVKMVSAVARAAFLSAALVSCLAYGQERITIYSAYENSQMRPLIQAFEKAYPDIKVDHFRQPGEELVATIELELRAGSPKADVVGLNSASLTYLQSKHRALAPYAAKGIENVRQEFRDPQNIITPAFINLYLIHYNTKKISAAEAPKSWADLVAPKWKNAVAMADPTSSQSVQTFVWFIGDYLGKNDPARFGWDYFKKLGANGVHLESSHGTIRDLTVSGERPIGVQLLANAQTAANRGEPTSVVWAAEGSPGEVSAFALMKDSKLKEAGRRWLDFVVSPEGQALMPNSLGGAPVRNDVAYKYPDGTPLDKVKIVPVDSAFIAENRKQQARKFHEALGR